LKVLQLASIRAMPRRREMWFGPIAVQQEAIRADAGVDIRRDLRH
jgi:hypothetical protein